VILLGFGRLSTVLGLGSAEGSAPRDSAGRTGSGQMIAIPSGAQGMASRHRFLLVNRGIRSAVA
jgi:hypothetical protein